MAASSIGAVSITVMFFCLSWAISVGALLAPMTASSMPSRSERVLRSMSWLSRKPNISGYISVTNSSRPTLRFSRMVSRISLRKMVRKAGFMRRSLLRPPG